LVLQLGRRYVLAASRDDDVLHAVGDLQVALVVDGPDVSGVQPAIAKCLSGLLRLIVVTHEDVRATQQDLAVRRDLELGTRGSHTHSPELEANGHAGGQTAILGLAIDLAHVDAQRAVPLYELGGDWGRTGAGEAGTVHADGALDIVEDEKISDGEHER